MTTTGHCPRCNSTLYTPDPGFGGAGRNKCLECSHIGPVADFHTEPVNPGFTKFYDSSIAAAITRDGQRIVREMTSKIGCDTDALLQQPITNPEGYRTDPKTGDLRPAKSHELFHTEKPAAPIRQYRDDDE